MIIEKTLAKEKEVLDYLNISRPTLWRLRKRGLPTMKVGESLRFDLEQVKEWVSSEPSSLDQEVFSNDFVSNDSITHNERIINDYQLNLDYLFNHNLEHLNKILKSNQIKEFKTILNNYNIDILDNQEVVKIFSHEYLKIIHNNYKRETETKYFSKSLSEFIENNKNTIKIIWGDCYKTLLEMETESIQLMVTSPPYFNARAYSQWENLDLYLDDMRKIIKESYRVLDNHRVWVFNVGDIFDNDRLKTKSVWGKRRIPLGAYFIKIFEEAGFEFVDDIIWDKGEVESKRHMNNGMNYPLYQYPLNCYEHLLIFHKHRLDTTKIPCPVCGTLNVNGNTQSEISVQSWECKNKRCFVRSPHNRGKRFSLRTNIMQYYHENNENNLIEKTLMTNWRRDIVKFPPVIKINSNGKNIIGHTAPFPEDIPMMAIKYFTYVGDNVLDPFSGSFTVPIVAQKLGRVGIGIEINKKLFRDAIIKRINDSIGLYDGKMMYQEYDD